MSIWGVSFDPLKHDRIIHVYCDWFVAKGMYRVTNVPMPFHGHIKQIMVDMYVGQWRIKSWKR